MTQPSQETWREDERLVAFLDELFAVRETLLHRHDAVSRELDCGDRDGER